MATNTQMDKIQCCAHMLLFELGITPDWAGFDYAAYAVVLAARQPEQLEHVTSRLYPAIAGHFGKSSMTVVRSLCRVISIAWDQNRDVLQSLVGLPLNQKPTPAEFIAILASAAQAMLY